ncbi:roquin-2-like [Uloborus diversus]|uniref:roquin-2-like n=1 Tax=Uloborus diversus TaxID=327109 RepID=UPI0024099660|nr:roquin-2-like [Uloborus diversus]
MPVQAPQWTEYLSCPTCSKEFECNVRCPVSLSCGHTMCRNCLLNLQQKQCPFDQTIIKTDINLLPQNYAILQLVGGKIPAEQPSLVPLVSDDDLKYYVESRKHVEDLALWMKFSSVSTPRSSPLSRPMQKKLVQLMNCQLAEDEGRARSIRATRALAERAVVELILQHQNPQQVSVNLWAAVRARGCQFLGPALQEEILKLVMLALEDGSALSRKVLVMFVVQRLSSHFPQSSKTSIGHVVQLLYRASCFKVAKRDGDSSLMQLKDEFRTYETLRREHDSQIVQIASEAGLRIAPEQWSSLLYGDLVHKSHMQSIIDKLQTPQSFSLSIQELVIALQRTGDPGNLSVLRPHWELLARIDPSLDAPAPKWEDLISAQEATCIAVKGLVDFIQNFGSRQMQEDRISLNVKYKTSMCRDFTQRDVCPRGANCTFAHSQDELEKYRAKTKKNPSNKHSAGSTKKTNLENPSSKQKTSDSTDGLSTVNATPNNIPPEDLPNSELEKDRHNFDLLDTRRSTSDHSISAVPNPNSVFNKIGITPECSMSSSISYAASIKPPFSLNSQMPLFQPVASKPTSIMFSQPQYQVTNNNNLNPQNYESLSTAALNVSTNIQRLPANLNLSNNCMSSQQLHNSAYLNSHEDRFSTIPNLQAANNMMNADHCKKYDAMSYQSSMKKEDSECQTLSLLQQKKRELLAELDKFCPHEADEVPLYSPWTSRSILSCESSVNFKKISDRSAFVGENSCNIKEKSDANATNRLSSSLFCPSEKDEFIPFDPPLASKYGPISRGSKRSICGQHPIGVNTVSQMSGLTNSTSVVHHPVPSASLNPSYPPKDFPNFSVPPPFVPKQYFPFANCFVPTAVDYEAYSYSDDYSLSYERGFGQKRTKYNHEYFDDSFHHVQAQELLPAEKPDAHSSKEELFVMDEAMQELSKRAMEYAALSSYRQSCNFTSDIVPTPVAPWPSQTWENVFLKYSEADYETKVGQGINDLQHYWLESLLRDEEDVWMAENG